MPTVSPLPEQFKGYHCSLFYKFREQLHPLFSNGVLQTKAKAMSARTIQMAVRTISDVSTTAIPCLRTRIEFDDLVRSGRQLPPLEEWCRIAALRAMYLEHVVSLRLLQTKASSIAEAVSAQVAPLLHLLSKMSSKDLDSPLTNLPVSVRLELEGRLYESVSALGITSVHGECVRGSWAKAQRDQANRALQRAILRASSAAEDEVARTAMLHRRRLQLESTLRHCKAKVLRVILQPLGTQISRGSQAQMLEHLIDALLAFEFAKVRPLLSPTIHRNSQQPMHTQFKWWEDELPPPNQVNQYSQFGSEAGRRFVANHRVDVPAAEILASRTDKHTQAARKAVAERYAKEQAAAAAAPPPRKRGRPRRNAPAPQAAELSVNQAVERQLESFQADQSPGLPMDVATFSMLLAFSCEDESFSDEEVVSALGSSEMVQLVGTTIHWAEVQL